MTTKYLDSSGLSYFWGKLKNYFQPKLVSGTNIKTINNTSLLGSGDIAIGGGGGLFVAEYNVTSFADIESAFNAGKDIVCAEDGGNGVTDYFPLYEYDSTNGVFIFTATFGESYYGYIVSEDGWDTYNEVIGTSIPTNYQLARFDSMAHMNSTDMSNAEVNSFVSGLNFTGGLLGDYVVEQGTSGDWSYRKWHSGKAEAWASLNLGSQSGTSWASPVRYKDMSITIPSGIFTSTPVVTATSATNQWWVVLANATSTTNISARFANVSSSASAITVNVYARG